MHKTIFWICLLSVIVAFGHFAHWEITSRQELVAQLIFNAPVYDATIDNNNSNIHSDSPVIPTQSSKNWLERWEWRRTRITQTEEKHIQQGNGSMYAIDIVSSDWNAYFPASHKEYIITHIGFDERIGDYVIIRNGTERWVYGHTITSRSKGVLINVEKDGSILGQSNLSGISTALHSHIELWRCPEKEYKMKDCNNVSNTGEVAPRNKELKEQRGWKEDESDRRTEKVSDNIRVIGCLNEKDMTIHEPNKGNCFLGNGWRWKNIMIPPQKDLDMFKKIFWEDYKYRLAIANFEGSFREDAGNASAYGYLQTLRSYKIPPDITSQLNWLAKREIGTTGRICDLNNNAPYGWDTKLDRYVCMARWHFGFHKPDTKHYSHGIMYWKRYRAVTEYYLSLNF